MWSRCFDLTPKIRAIEQKFCELGYSSIQEVDNKHTPNQDVVIQAPAN